MSKFYTGIGRRKTPTWIQDTMTALATALEKKGYTLRSGGAEGADTAFNDGIGTNTYAEIYLPWNGFNGLERDSKQYILPSEFENYDQAWEIMTELVPHWGKVSAGVQALHTRNVYQVLGKDLNTPSKFVLFWAEEDEDGDIDGGTRTAVVLARQRGIPTFNLWKTEDYNRVNKMLEG